jgi:carboxyl-terminal processing protease
MWRPVQVWLRRWCASAVPLGIGLVLGFALALSTGVRAYREPAAPTLSVSDGRLIEGVLTRIGADYVERVDLHRLLHRGLSDMVAQLDPYSALLDANEFEQLRQRTSGSYCGIGVEIGAGPGGIEITRVHLGSPAERAGIRRGDRLVAVNGEALAGNEVHAVAERLQGAAGSAIALTVARGEALPFDLSVTRAPVRIDTVAGHLLEGGVGYVRIFYFADATPEELERQINDLKHENGGPLAGLVLDLRANPGGVLESGIAVADDFLDDGVIVRSVGRDQDSNFVARATPGDLIAGRPLAVLIDSGSASAAEIVAQALKDNRRATLVGRKTYGKGSVQTILPLSDGGALRLTTARWSGPSGTSLAGVGLEPDLALTAPAAGSDPGFGASGRDPDLAAALDVLARAPEARLAQAPGP